MSQSLKIPIPYYKEIFKYFFIVICLYLYLFQPPVINKNIYIVFEGLIVLAYAMFQRNFVFSFFKKYSIEVFILFCLIMYCLVRDLLVGEVVYFDRFLAWSFQSFVVGYFILDLYHKKKVEPKNKIDIFNLLYWASFLAAILTALLIFYKPFDIFYESIQLDQYYERYEDFDFRYRAYGISENLTFTYSYVLGLFAGYSLLVLHKNRFLIFPFLLFCLGIFFNARIGFVALFIFVVIFITKFSIKRLVQLLLSILGALFLITLLLPNQLDIISENSAWGLNFFYEISDLLFGTNYALNDVSTFDTLTGSFIVFPDNFLAWFFGTGESLFTKSENNSDIGYILQLYYGGVILLVILSILIIFMFNRLRRTIGITHWFTIFFFLSVLILNFKGFVFAATPGGRLLFFLYIYFTSFYLYRKEVTTK